MRRGRNYFYCRTAVFGKKNNLLIKNTGLSPQRLGESPVFLMYFIKCLPGSMQIEKKLQDHQESQGEQQLIIITVSEQEK